MSCHTLDMSSALPMNHTFIVVVETPRLGGGVPVRRGYAVSSDSPVGAESIVRPKLTDDETMYVLAKVPIGGWEAVGLKYGKAIELEKRVT
jgi:hypothetical protein